jgi:hypothetical protein
MHTITLTPREIKAFTNALDQMLVVMESDDDTFEDREVKSRYKILSNLYSKLLKQQLGVSTK